MPWWRWGEPTTTANVTRRRAEALASGRDPATDEVTLAALGNVDWWIWAGSGMTLRVGANSVSWIPRSCRFERMPPSRASMAQESTRNARLKMLCCGIRVAMTACAFAGTILLGHAAAEEPRTVPRAGESLTYRIIVTTTLKTATGSKDQSTGWNYTYHVTSSGDHTADGTIELTTVYTAPNCPPNACDAVRREMDRLKARKEGAFYAVDIPPAVTRALTKLSAFRWRHFIPELTQVALPNMRTGPGKVQFDPTAAQVQLTRLDCDKAALESFFPMGKSPRVSVPCTQSGERSQAGRPLTGTRFPKQEITFDISYEGQGTVTTPSGEWRVQKIRMTSSRPKSPANWVTEIFFSEQLGAIVKEHSITTMATSSVSVQNDRELIAVSQ